MPKTLIDEEILERIIEKKKRLDSIRPVSKPALQQLKERFVVEWTYNSNAIEGNTLTLNETRLVLERGLTVKGKSLREHFEAVNHKDAIIYLENILSLRSARSRLFPHGGKIAQNKKPVTEELIKKLHAIITKCINDAEAGVYRNVRVRILGAAFTPPNPLKIPNLMSEFTGWLNTAKIQPVELAALAHHKLVYIHPFSDGNGRTSRLLMNLILMRAGFPPAVVLNSDRKKYYDRLKQADLGNAVPFVNFIGQSVERSLDLYLEVLEPVKPEENKELISLAEAAKSTPYSAEYLSLLARKGKLGAVKISRNWMISRDALRRYVEKIKQKHKSGT